MPKRLLEGFAGIVLTDGYEAYGAAVTAHALTHAGCWAHARRKFDEARKVHSDAQGRARIALDFIGRLYAIERSVRERTVPLGQTAHLELRQAHSAPILAEFHSWLCAMAGEVLPQSALGKAIAYALAQWMRI